MIKTVAMHSLDDTKAFAQTLAAHVFPDFLITLSGDLGAGKTTFTKYFGAALGVKKTINSPTFTIMKSYQGRLPIYHIDAYRLEGVTQELGFEEVFEDGGVCIVEWPQFIDAQLPVERLEIVIHQIGEEEREFEISAKGTRYENVLEALR